MRISVSVAFRLAAAALIVGTAAPAHAAAPTLTVETIMRDGQRVASALDVTASGLDGSSLRQGVHEGDVLPVDVRVAVPSDERVRIAGAGGTATISGASDAFHFTGKFESVAMLGPGETQIDDPSNAFIFFGPSIELTGHNASYAVETTGENATVTRSAGTVTAALLGHDAYVARLDLLTNARPSIIYRLGVQTLVDASAAEDASAAAAGDANAEFNLGTRYYWGNGVTADATQALHWLETSAAQRSAEAENSIGFAYAYGTSGVQYMSKAADWLNRAATDGSGAAEDTLGDMYNYGHGVSQSYAQAMQWYQRAATLGDADAENDIGLLYYTGHANQFGETPNYNSAMHWFWIAAAQGNGDAENDLGYAYENGHGVAQDYAQALTWFHRSAAQQDRAAEYNLGEMYENGRGVQKDNVEALHWYRLAAAQGSASAQRAVERVQSLPR